MLEPALPARVPLARPSWLAAMGWATLAIEGPALLGWALAQGSDCRHCRDTLAHAWPLAPGTSILPLEILLRNFSGFSLASGISMFWSFVAAGVVTAVMIVAAAWVSRHVPRWPWVLVGAASWSMIVVLIFLMLLRA